MNQQLTLNPEMVYQLVSSNPNLRQIVEQTAYLNTVNQQTQQMRMPNGYTQWYQPQQQIMGQPQQQTPVVLPDTTQSSQPLDLIKPQEEKNMNLQALGIPNINEIINQAQGVLGRFDNSFKVINDNIKALFDEIESLNKKIDSLSVKSEDEVSDESAKIKKRVVNESTDK